MKVFIAGCGRSGTTYLKTLVDASPLVFAPAETLCFADYLANYGSIKNSKLTKLFYTEPQLMSWFSGKPRFDLSIPDCIQYVHEYEMEKHGAKFWGQKTPRFVRHIDLFNRHFPDIKWVLVHRDPRSVVASMLNSTRHTYSVSSAVKRWKYDNAPIIELLKKEQIDKDKYHIISYEQLIGDVEGVLENVFNFLGIQMPDIDVIYNYDYGKEKSRDYEGFKFKRNEIREGLKPNTSHIDRWKSQLSDAQISYIERECSSEMEVFGYQKSLSADVRSLKFTLDEKVNKLKTGLIIWQYIKNWPEYLWKSQKRKVLFAFWRKVDGKD